MLVLHTFKPHATEAAPAWGNGPVRSWRWVFGLFWGCLGFVEQVSGIGGGAPWDGHWFLATRYFIVGFGHWRFGLNHVYYDGPHCSLGIGFVRFDWSLRWCKRCDPDSED